MSFRRPQITPVRAVLGVGVVLILAVLWFTTARPVLVLPRLRLAPGYALTAADGAPVTSEDQRGRLTLYSFAYSGCAERCKGMYTTLMELDAALAERGVLNPPLRFITISIDPQDTPQRLAQFALPFQPRAVEWLWLTGPESTLRMVIGAGFEVLAQPDEAGGFVLAPRFVLVDGAGIIRGEYDAAVTSPDQIAGYLDILYAEIEKSTGASKLAYEAAHFFACYPH